MLPKTSLEFCCVLLPRLLALLSVLAFCGVSPAVAALDPVMTVDATGVASVSWQPSTPGKTYRLETLVMPPFGERSWKTCRSDVGWPIAETSATVQLQPDVPALFRVVAGSEPAIQRGALKSIELLRSHTVLEQNQLLAQLGLYPSMQASSIVDVYFVNYETVDVWDRKTVASGMIMLPRGTAPVSVLGYQHSTTIHRYNVPSFGGPEYSGALLCAAVGHCVVSADYLGLGTNEGYHPYLHARSEATAVVDMLRASRAALAQLSRQHDGQLFLAGFSQGGHVTMAAHRELQRMGEPTFTVTAAAPIAGSYSVSRTIVGQIQNEDYPQSAFGAYVLHSYQRLYGIADGWGALFKAPYDAQAPQVFDGVWTDHPAEEDLHGLFPQTLSALVAPGFTSAISDDPESHPIYRRLLENDLLDWVPVAPVRIYHSSGDSIVPFENAQLAYAAFQSGGADVQLINDHPSMDHEDYALYSLVQALLWFSTF